jgi:hypothetical protein
LLQDKQPDQQQQDEGPKPYSAAEGMQAVIALLEKSVKTKETRLLMGRLLRQTAALRKAMSGSDLAGFIAAYLPPGLPSAAFLAGFVQQVCSRVCVLGVWRCTPPSAKVWDVRCAKGSSDDHSEQPHLWCSRRITSLRHTTQGAAPMEEDAAGSSGAGDKAQAAPASPKPSSLPEVELYMYLLVLVHLLDKQQHEQVCAAWGACAVCDYAACTCAARRARPRAFARCCRVITPHAAHATPRTHDTPHTRRGRWRTQRWACWRATTAARWM